MLMVHFPDVSTRYRVRHKGLVHQNHDGFHQNHVWEACESSLIRKSFGQREHVIMFLLFAGTYILLKHALFGEIVDPLYSHEL